MKTSRLAVLCVACVSLLFVGSAAAQDDGWRTIEFETTEVTQPDVTLSPDGRWLVFTMLGHLLRLPVEGGTAEQLSFGPYFDTDPVFSPDGRRVAFVSDRDGSEGNVFVLELGTGEITQLSHEPWAGRPEWSPDGVAIAYLARETAQAEETLVRRLVVAGGEPETLSPEPRAFDLVFYLPDRRLAWTVIESVAGSSTVTKIEVRDPTGTSRILRTVAGRSLGVVASSAGDALYLRREISLPGPDEVELVFLPLPDGAERTVLPAKVDEDDYLRFAVARDNQSLYLGDQGRLWNVALSGGARQPIAFRARVQMEVQDPIPPPTWTPSTLGSSALPRSILSPRLSPDGKTLIFGAAGYLWQQPLDGGPAQRLFEGSALESGPAYSPDGRYLAFLRGELEERLTVFDFESRTTRTLDAAGRYWRSLSWTPDGTRLLFRRSPSGVVAVNISDGEAEELVDLAQMRARRPHLSADGETLYFTAGNADLIETLYRVPLRGDALVQRVTQLARSMRDGLVSPDGRWLAFRRNTEIWVVPLGTEPVTDQDVRRLSPEGERTFAFTPDGSALIYSSGNRVWRHPLRGGEPEEIPIRLEFDRPTPPPVLLRRARVLDVAGGGFGAETSLFIERGRIRWIGSERGRRLPEETIVIDAGGRFAIPGLFDLHVHAARPSRAAYQAAFLAYGVTSVRDTGSDLLWTRALVDRDETTRDPVPRHFFAGDIFDGPSSGLGQPTWIHDENDARTYVRRWHDRGVHFIKVYIRLPWPLQKAVAEEARRLGLPVVGHLGTVERTTKSVTLGYAVLEHEQMDPRPYDDVLQLLAQAGTRWDPTLSLRAKEVLLRAEPERLADPKFRAFTPDFLIRNAQREVRARTTGRADALRAVWIEVLAAIRAAQRLGVKLQVGTDAPIVGAFYGASLHWEMEHFVEAGLVPLEVLRLATQQAAEAVGADEQLGTLEPGKLADLVLLDANPLEDIRNTQTIWRTIKGGWIFDPEELRPASTGN